MMFFRDATKIFVYCHMTSQIFYWSILCFDHLTGILNGYSNFMHDQHCIHHFENGDKYASASVEFVASIAKIAFFIGNNTSERCCIS